MHILRETQNIATVLRYSVFEHRNLCLKAEWFPRFACPKPAYSSGRMNASQNTQIHRGNSKTYKYTTLLKWKNACTLPPRFVKSISPTRIFQPPENPRLSNDHSPFSPGLQPKQNRHPVQVQPSTRNLGFRIFSSLQFDVIFGSTQNKCSKSLQFDVIFACLIFFPEHPTKVLLKSEEFRRRFAFSQTPPQKKLHGTPFQKSTFQNGPKIHAKVKRATLPPISAILYDFQSATLRVINATKHGFLAWIYNQDFCANALLRRQVLQTDMDFYFVRNCMLVWFKCSNMGNPCQNSGLHN